MLITSYQHFTTIERWRNLLRFTHQMIFDRKEQKKKLKTFSKQMCVSSQNKQYEKRRGRHRIGYTYLLSQRAASCVRRAVLGSVLPWKPSNLQRESSINYHKCPNYETPAIFRHSSSLTLQNRWTNETKKCSWVWEQTKKHKNVIKWHK